MKGSRERVKKDKDHGPWFAAISEGFFQELRDRESLRGKRGGVRAKEWPLPCLYGFKGLDIMLSKSEEVLGERSHNLKKSGKGGGGG